jgi:elongation factor P
LVTPNDFDTGMAIYVDGDLCLIENYQHSKQARGSAIVKTKLRNMETDEVQEKRFGPDDDFKQAIIDEKPAEFLYTEGEILVFMDMETYDQVQLSRDSVGEKADYLTENLECHLKYCDGDPIDIVLPGHVTLEVKDTSPGVKGDTAQGGTKPAVMDSGLEVDVPLFISEGDKVTVNTDSSEYVGREEE